MPIVIPDSFAPPIFYPKSNYQIVRYLDISKFISILQKGALFFCRLDIMQDHFEGSIPSREYQYRWDFIEGLHRKDSNFKKKTVEEIQLDVKNLYITNERIKSVTCISSWNISNSESAALWKIYLDFKQGIMIVSKISSVISAFNQTKEDILMSETKYIDYENETFSGLNTITPIIHKHRVYEYGKELRLIHTLPYESGTRYDWSKEQVQTGKYLKVDVNSLIDTIIISPYAEKWFTELITDLCKKYNLNKPILESEFATK